MTGTVGIIANPASGKDIRRLVAHASVFNNHEKVNIVRRVLLGLQATGVARVLFMPDTFSICLRALDNLNLALDVQPVPGDFTGAAHDTTLAAAAMADHGVDVIVSLGGDGTNRALAKGCQSLPLVPISTGTNNVFSTMIEGTVAGLAAGAIAVGAVDAARVSQPCKWIEVAVDGVRRDIALIDCAVLHDAFVGSRAIWKIELVNEVLLTRAQPDTIGLAAIGGMIQPTTPQDNHGLHLVLGEGGPVVRAAIAPGVIQEVRLARVSPVAFGDMVPVAGPALFALDGEREFAIGKDERATLHLARLGPPVVDIPQCLLLAQQAELLRRG